MIFLSKIIILLFANISYGHDILFDTKLVTDLRNFFQIRWLIIYTCDKSFVNPSIFKLLMETKKDGEIFMTLYDSDDFFRFTKARSSIFHKAMVLFPCWNCEKNCLTQLKKLNEIDVFSRFIWIALIANDLKYFRHFHLPYNSMFGVMRKKDVNNWDLVEIYRTEIGSPWVENKLGTWSESNGLMEMTNLSMYERKADFFGLNMTAHFKIPDPGWELKYPYFYLDLFSDLAKRLNITTHITNDMDDDYEVSVSLYEIKIPYNYENLQTLHTSWVVLFFVDLKTELVLDSFIEPFQLDVWLTILIWIFVTSFTSFQISKLINKLWARPQILSKPFHQYFFEYLTVIFQKYEDPKENFLSQRIIQIIHWIISINIYAFYSAILIAFVTVIIRIPPFSTLEGVMDNGKYNIVIGHSDLIPQIINHPKENIQKLFKYHYDKNLVINNLHQAVQMICSGDKKLAAIHSYNRYQKAKVDFPNCAISDTYIRLKYQSFSWLIKRKSPYKKIFQNCLSEMIQAGGVLSLYNKRTVLKKDKDLQMFYKIKISQVLFLYILLSAGIVLSLLILVLEVYISGLRSND